jgi:hypothetical protein
MARRVKYLNNRDLLKEIHKSKNTFCSYLQPEFNQYDLIVSDLDRINVRTTAEAKRNQAARLSKADWESACENISSGKKPSQKDFEIDYRKIKKTDVVFRVMTFEHIPLAPGRKKTVKTTADAHEKVNFPPFQHWKFDDKTI